MTFESIKDFYNYFEHKPKIVGLNQGRAWFKWPGKSFYADGIGYYPDASKAPLKLFNTFKGFGCAPLSGDVKLILTHIHEILCGGDSLASNYFLHWLAHIFQKPEEKPSVAILMKSAEGTGKGTLYRLLKKMLAANANQVNGHQQLTGRFNSVIAGKLLIFGDEVDLTSKAVFDKAKGIISEPTISLELKGIDAEPIPNFARFIFAGNHGQILRAGTRERRFLVIEPSSKKVDDKKYFSELNTLIDGNGASYFLEHLIHIDISSFNPYKAPVTKGLIEEKLSSLVPTLSFFHEELHKEKPFNNAAKLYANDLISLYMQWSENNNLAPTIACARTQIGKTMKSLNFKAIGRSGRDKGIYYDLPCNDDFKAVFSKHLGHNSDDIF
jgi:putative DNA primase/helicase